MALPSNYTRLYYVESSGSQYVKTGLFFSNANSHDIRMVIDADFATTAFSIVGCASYLSFYVGVGSGGKIGYSTALGDVATTVSYPARKRYKYDLNNRGNQFTIYDGTTVVYTANTTISSYTGAKELYLFAFNSSDSGSANGSTMKLYEAWLYLSGSLVRHYIPCKSPTNVVGLWDDVAGVFHGSDSGIALIAGPVAELPAPTGLTATKMELIGDWYVYINWTAVQGATSYIISKNGVALVQSYSVGYLDPLADIADWETVAYSIQATDGVAVSPPAEISFTNIPDNPLPYLITDRTQSDVDALNAKGTYSPTDWNRVGAAVAYVTDALADKGYIVPTAPKTDWSNYDIPTSSQLEQYRRNVDLIRTAVIELANPDMPNSMIGLDYKEANALEQILLDVYDLLDHINLVPCGLPSCGVLWADYGG